MRGLCGTSYAVACLNKKTTIYRADPVSDRSCKSTSPDGIPQGIERISSEVANPRDRQLGRRRTSPLGWNEQADKLATMAEPTGCGTVSVMFDLDREGVNGSQQAILEIAKRCRTRFAWTAALADGQFKGRQPESVTPQEWETAIHPALMVVS